jgi:POT family proton-dependent oligopeptide transporter
MIRHPRALYLLALVQLWERFACFASLPVLVLYLQQAHGLRADTAVLLFGLLQALSYLGGLPGGQLADRWLGQRLATLLGTVLLTLGYGTLALDRPALLWPALALLVAGHGLFKPGLNALAGSLYSEDDPRRDSGFLLLHFIFNAGATVAPTVAEWARARWGWVAIFQVATLGMLVSTVCAAAAAIVLRPVHRARGTEAALPARQRERERVRACWLVCGVGVVFWLAAVQASTSLTLFAEQHTELGLVVLGRSLTVAPGHFMSLHSLLVLVLTPPLGWLLSTLRRRGEEVTTPAKMGWGFAVTGASFALMAWAGLHGGDTSRVGLSWLSGCYVLLTVGELLLAPMGLALVTRLAPPQKTSRMVAIWFAATAAGNGLAGVAGYVWTCWPHHRYFVLLALLCLAAAAVLRLRLGSLEQLLARSLRASLQPPKERTAPMNPPGVSTNASPSPAPRRARLILASLAILGPVPLLVLTRLPLPVRAVSAIGCGLAVLLCGAWLLAQAIDWMGRQPTSAPR